MNFKKLLIRRGVLTDPAVIVDLDKWFDSLALTDIQPSDLLLAQARENLKLVEVAKKGIEDKADRLLIFVSSAATTLVALQKIVALPTWCIVPSFACFVVVAILAVFVRRPIDLFAPMNVRSAMEKNLSEEQTKVRVTAAYATAFEELAAMVNPRGQLLEWASWIAATGLFLLSLLLFSDTSATSGVSAVSQVSEPAVSACSQESTSAGERP